MVEKLELSKEQEKQFEQIHKAHKEFHKNQVSQKEKLKSQKEELMQTKRELFLKGSSDEEFEGVFKGLQEIREKYHNMKTAMFDFYNSQTLKKKNLLTKNQRKLYSEHKENHYKHGHHKGYSCKGDCPHKKGKMCERSKK